MAPPTQQQQQYGYGGGGGVDPKYAARQAANRAMAQGLGMGTSYSTLHSSKGRQMS
jgi:hypothetical protein